VLAGGLSLLAAAGAIGGTVGGLEYVRKSENNGPGQQDIIAKQCPKGKRVLGGGVFGSGGYDKQQINSTRPLDADDLNGLHEDGWEAYMDNQTSSPLAVKVHAICSKARPTYVETAQIQIASGTATTGLASCPPDTHVASGGFYAAGGIDQQNLVDSYPVDLADGNTTPDDGWSATSHNVSVGIRYFRVYAICGKARPRYVEKQRSAKAEQRTTKTVKCRGGRHVTGGGIDVLGDQRFFHLNSSYPIDLRDSDHVPDDAWRMRGDDLDVGNRAISIFAICKG